MITKRYGRILLFLVLASGCPAPAVPVGAQQVSIATGMPQATYAIGQTVGDPFIVPALTNRFRMTLDRSELGPGTEGTLVEQHCQEFDGVSWNNCGAFGTFGGCIPNRFTSEDDCIVTSGIMNIIVPSIEPRMRRIVYENGGPNPVAVQTNSAVQMWEVK